MRGRCLIACALIWLVEGGRKELLKEFRAVVESPCNPSLLGQCDTDGLRAAARSVLESNVRDSPAFGRYTLSWADAYPHIRTLDAALTLMGRARYDISSAAADLKALFTLQWQSGFVPHMGYDPSVPASPTFPSGDFIPGPGFWSAAPTPFGGGAPVMNTSGLAAPPVIATAALLVLENDGIVPSDTFDRAYAYHEYLAQYRVDSERPGLYFIRHPWESLLPFSESFASSFGASVPRDKPPRDVDADDYKSLSGLPGWPGESAMNQGLNVAACLRECSYADESCIESKPDACGFKVASVDFNVAVARDLLDLYSLGERLGVSGTGSSEERDQKLRQAARWASDAINATDAFLRDPAGGYYHDRDLLTGRLNTSAIAVTGLLPLGLKESDSMPAAHVEQLLAYIPGPDFAGSTFARLPTLSRQDEGFVNSCSVEMQEARGRPCVDSGPISIRMNLLSSLALLNGGAPGEANSLASCTVALMCNATTSPETFSAKHPKSGHETAKKAARRKSEPHQGRKLGKRSEHSQSTSVFYERYDASTGTALVPGSPRASSSHLAAIALIFLDGPSPDLPNQQKYPNSKFVTALLAIELTVVFGGMLFCSGGSLWMFRRELRRARYDEERRLRGSRADSSSPRAFSLPGTPGTLNERTHLLSSESATNAVQRRRSATQGDTPSDDADLNSLVGSPPMSQRDSYQGKGGVGGALSSLGGFLTSFGGLQRNQSQASMLSSSSYRTLDSTD